MSQQNQPLIVRREVGRRYDITTGELVIVDEVQERTLQWRVATSLQERRQKLNARELESLRKVAESKAHA